MKTHNCQALVITCIDFRLQEFINNWINKNLSPKTYDRVALAGGVKDFESISNQVEISKKLHNIEKVVLINHEDCGAYGKDGTEEIHSQDLNQAKKSLNEKYPDLLISTYYLKLDGTFKVV